MRDSVFTLGHPRTEVSHARLSSGVGLSMAQCHLYVICCLEHRVLAWKHNRKTTHLQRYWHETSHSSLVQIADVNAPTDAQPEPSQAEHRLNQGCGVNAPICHAGLPSYHNLTLNTLYTAYDTAATIAVVVAISRALVHGERGRGAENEKQSKLGRSSFFSTG